MDDVKVGFDWGDKPTEFTDAKWQELNDPDKHYTSAATVAEMIDALNADC